MRLKKLIITVISIVSVSNVNAADSLIKGTAVGLESSCVKGNECLIYSKHHAWITNDKYKPKTFYVRYKICASSNECNRDRYQIVVNHGTWNDGKTMKVKTKYHYVGNRYFSCETMIFDDKLKTIETFGGNGVVHIHE